MKESSAKLIELENIIKQDDDVFPYDDIFELLRKYNISDDDFTSKLDLFDSTIRGYCSWGLEALNWTNLEARKVKEDIRLSFFEKYPEFEFLREEINSKNFPNLLNDLQKTENLRLSLVSILKNY